MTREEATGIAYDASLDALSRPAAAGRFFELHAPCSEAAWCAEFSRLAYADFATALPSCLERIGFQLLAAPFDRDGTQAFLAEGPDFTILAFRGSDDIDAWMTNLNALPTSWRGTGKVHRGFAEALELVWSDVEPALARATGTLLMTGHSLGGALAILAAGLCPEARLFTFGAPRVGDRAFRAALHARPAEAHRYVNHRDIVPRVPPATFGYRHVGIPYVIDRDGRVEQREPEDRGVTELLLSALPQGSERLDQLFGRELPRELSDHAPINYVSALR